MIIGKKFLQLKDISAYRIALQLSNYVWSIVIKWSYFEKDTIGKQFVRAADSISANIAEGFGRYTKRDKIVFYRYSYGSIKEALDWNEKAKTRGLLSKEQYEHIFEELQKLPKLINQLIYYIKANLRL